MFHQDLPIENSEQDIFNRRKYAQNLAEALLKSQYKSSFVVGLYGSWGSGKTSLCNMILEKVKEEIDIVTSNDASKNVKNDINDKKFTKEEQIVIFQFNPWICSDANQLINQFFTQLGGVINENNAIKEGLKTLLIEYGELLLFTKFIPGVGSYLELFTGAVTKRVKNAAEHKDIQKLKTQISNELQDKNVKLFITIDDIDRLSEQEIVAVFQLVKALGDFPNTIYFLCFDYDIVTTALNKIHANKGKEYLEKIVQMPITLPAISTNILKNILDERIKKIIDNTSIIKFNDDKYSKLIEILLENYITTIRDITRFENIFVLKYNLLKEVTDPVDLLALSSIELFEANFFPKLYYLKIMLFEQNTALTKKQVVMERNKELKAIVDSTSTYNNYAIINILQLIFPTILLENEVDNKIINPSFIISNKEYFDRYFDLSILEPIFSFNYIRDILLKNSYDFTEELNKINSQQNLSIFINELLMFLQTPKNFSISREIAVKTCKELCLEWNKFKLPNSGLYEFMGNKLSLIIFELLSILTQKEQEDLLITCIFENQNVHPSTIGTILLRLRNFKIQYPNIYQNILITDELLQRLEEIFIKRSIETLDLKEKLLEYNGLDFLMLFYNFLKRSGQNKYYYDKIKKLSSIEELIIPIFRWSINYIAPEKVKIYIQRLKIFMTNQEALEKVTTLTCNERFLMYDSETQFILIIILLALTDNINRTDEDDYFITFEQIHMKLEEIKNNLQIK